MLISIDIPFLKGDKVWVGNVFSHRKDFNVQSYIINDVIVHIQNEKEYCINYHFINKPGRILPEFSTTYVYKTKKRSY